MENNDRKTKGFGKNTEYRMYLVRKRNEVGLSINKLARLTYTQRQQYYRFEKGITGGKVSLMYFATIVLALGFNLEEAYYLEKQYQEFMFAKYGKLYWLEERNS